MRNPKLIVLIIIATVFMSCDDSKPKHNNSPRINSENNDDARSDGFNVDSVNMAIQPGGVLLTGNDQIRLSTVFMVNYNIRQEEYFIGSNNFHFRYDEIVSDSGNNWNNHLIPGLEAVYGYNMVNVAHYDLQSNTRKNLFPGNVLIGTVYYPAYSKDTLFSQPVKRDYIMVSVYDADTNKDGFISTDDLRHMYLYDMYGKRQGSIVQANYGVYKSEYDPANDMMFIYARLDKNKNGTCEEQEPSEVFWIDLKNPKRSGKMY